MSQPDIEKDSKELLAEIREQILYLRDLGVEHLAAGLPEAPRRRNAAAAVSETPAPEVVVKKTDEYVPPEGFLENYRPHQAPEQPRAQESRLGLLEQTKLSHLSDAPARRPLRPSDRVQPAATNEPAAPKADAADGQPVLVDIKGTLPSSSETAGDIRANIGDCKRCPLSAGRTNVVHSTGNFSADLMFVGEAPGADEDAQSEPFVGRAGQLLTKIIEGIGLKREDVLIGNINRCRPPGNRQPTAEESAACKPFLLREIAVVRPKVIVVLGNTATQNLLETKVGITKLRGNFQDYYGVKVMPTFHPAFLLRDPRKKREVWDDMKKVRDEINKLK